jgi:hypothetical protein
MPADARARDLGLWQTPVTCALFAVLVAACSGSDDTNPSDAGAGGKSTPMAGGARSVTDGGAAGVVALGGTSGRWAAGTPNVESGGATSLTTGGTRGLGGSSTGSSSTGGASTGGSTGGGGVGGSAKGGGTTGGNETAGSLGAAGVGGSGTGGLTGVSGTGGSGTGGVAGTSAAGGSVRCDAGDTVRDPNPFVHPGGLHKRSDMDRMRYMVEAGVEPWATSFQNLRNDARASFDYVVNGSPSFTLVARGGTNGPAFESDVTAAYLNALMWIVTGDSPHAQKCVEIFNTWKNLTEVTGGGTEALNAGLYAWKLVEAAEIIRSTYSGWAAADLRQFQDMLVFPGYSSSSVPSSLTANYGTFYWRIHNGDPGRHGNQDLIAWRAMISMGVFLDNRLMYERALRYFKGEPHPTGDLAYPSGPSPSGAQIADNQYFTTYQYGGSQGTTADYGYNGVLGQYIWENGQCQESSRDQQHALFGLGIAAGIAEVAWNQGDGVYNSLDNRLLKGFEFTGRYNTSYIASFTDQSSPWEPSGSELMVRTDRTGRWRSKAMNPYFESDFVTVSRGDFPGKRPVFEQPLAHFQVRMGVPSSLTTWTERSRDVSIERAGYEQVGFSLDHSGWGGLTFRRPEGCAGDPISGFVSGLPQFSIPRLPATLEAENYDYFPEDGEGHTYHELTAGNSGGQYRQDGVDIQCGEEGPYLTSLEAGEWVTYTVYVPTAGTYRIELRYAAASSGGALRFAFGGSDVTADVPLPSTGGMASWATYTLPNGVALTAGVQAMRVSIAGSSGAFVLNRIAVVAG